MTHRYKKLNPVYQSVRRQTQMTEPISCEEMLARVFLDRMERKQRSWRLLAPDECAKMVAEVARFDLEADVGFPHAGGFHGHGTTEYKDWGEWEREAMGTFNDFYTMLDPLLREFRGHLIAAGGSVFRAMAGGKYDDDDCDLFFISPEYERILPLAVLFLRDRWAAGDCLHRNHWQDGECDHTTDVCRSIHAITVKHYCCGRVREIYQFVLRSYPSAAHVLGGFDIQAAAVCYDGFHITGTEFGFWSACTSMVIVDTTRRSTTYEYRLRKYSRLCTIVFPGLEIGRLMDQYVCVEWDDVKRVAEENGCEIDLVDDDYGHWTESERMARDDRVVPCYPSEDSWCNGRKNLCLAHRENFPPGWNILARYERENGYKCAAIITKSELKTRKLDVSELAGEDGFADKLRERFGAGGSANICVSAEITESEQVQLDSAMKNIRSALRLNDNAYISDAGDKFYRPGHRSVSILPIIGLRVDMCELTSMRCRFNWWNPKSGVISDYGYEERRARVGHYCHSDEEIPPPWGDNGTQSDSAERQSIRLACQRRNLQLSVSLTGIGTAGEFMRVMSFPDGPEFVEKTIAHAKWMIESLHARPELYKYKRYKLLFGDCLPKNFLKMPDQQAAVQAAAPIVIDQIRELTHAAVEALTSIKWITENPGRQWTASFNPIIEDPSEWYGKYHKKVEIGNVKLETTMRLLRRRPPFNMLPRDVFNMLLVRVLAADARSHLRGRKRK
jgi:hypothetical protein